MKVASFRRRAEELSNSIMDAIEAHFATSNIPFDKDVFTTETSIDLTSLAVEAMIYGANLAADYTPEAAILMVA